MNLKTENEQSLFQSFHLGARLGEPSLVIIPNSGDYLISFAVKADYTAEHRRIMVLLLEKIVLLKEN
jgi:hypothetical protein